MYEEILAGIDRDPRDSVFLVTEVTRMSGDTVCVAAIDLTRERVVRLLRWNHHNWDGVIGAALCPGSIAVQRIRGGQDAHGLPHQNEDTQLENDLVIRRRLPAQNFYEVARASVDPSVRAIFGHMVDQKYVVAGADVRSLGSVASTHVEIVDAGGKAYVAFAIGAAQYQFRLTSRNAMTFFETHGRDMMNVIIRADIAAGNAVVLRIGLARHWDGGESNRWNPERCYGQVNAVILANGAFEF